MVGETGDIEYHYGFYGGIRAKYAGDDIRLLQEYELGDEPVRLDMLVIRNGAGHLLGDEIGQFFRSHNVIEYKSPKDRLSVAEFYKTQGYALIYKGLEKTVDEIPIEELTVSIFRHAYPREMFRRLEESGLKIENRFPGVYYVTGAVCVPTQVVVISRLPEGTYPEFKVLAKGFKREDVEKLLMMARERDDPEYAEYVKAILNVSIAIDEPMFEKIKKEGGAMGEAVERLFKEELEEREQKGREEGREEGRQEGEKKGFLDALFGLVKDGLLSATDAAKRANMNVSEFEKAYKTFGL